MKRMAILAATLLIIGILAVAFIYKIYPESFFLDTPISPRIYTMQFGVTVNKFVILNDRLHLLIPLPVTGKSGNIIDVYKIEKKGRKGK